jgi:L-methionine (R)-S-oxide reductase
VFTQQQYAGTLQENYDLLCKQLDALLEGERNVMANLANASALLNQFLDRTNWVGFYVMDGEDELVLGPFQGLPACVRIALGKGVCGTAARDRQTQLVEDVHAFPGHIACDAASRSEVVVPIIVEGRVFGVLDIDSPELARFSEEDARGLEKFVRVLEKHLQ